MHLKKKWFSIVTIFLLLILLSACSQQNAQEAIIKKLSQEKLNLEFSDDELETYIIDNFKITLQTPELPTGCEITAMTMLLNYYGLEVDKVTMATKYLPTTQLQFYYAEDGRLYGSNLKRFFIGNPADNTGYVCGTEAIITAANRYLRDQDSTLTAVDKTGATPKELYQFINQNTPVVVWITIDMEERNFSQGWYTARGEYVDWSTNDHGAVLIGYSENTVTIADPISGQVEYNRQQFEQVFLSRDNQCVVLQ